VCEAFVNAIWQAQRLSAVKIQEVNRSLRSPRSLTVRVRHDRARDEMKRERYLYTWASSYITRTGSSGRKARSRLEMRSEGRMPALWWSRARNTVGFADGRRNHLGYLAYKPPRTTTPCKHIPLSLSSDWYLH
jgi:hypothetical protein